MEHPDRTSVGFEPGDKVRCISTSRRKGSSRVIVAGHGYIVGRTSGAAIILQNGDPWPAKHFRLVSRSPAIAYGPRDAYGSIRAVAGK